MVRGTSKEKNIYFPINVSMTFSWSSTVSEKQTVLRAKHLIRLQSVRLLRAMYRVNILPIRYITFGHLPTIVSPIVAGYYVDIE